MQVAVRNTFINVEERYVQDEAEDDDGLFRSASEGNAPQVKESSVERLLDSPLRLQGAVGSSAPGGIPDWPISTPDPSPVQSPRGGAVLGPLPSLLQAYLLQQNAQQQAHCTEIGWPRCSNFAPTPDQGCQDVMLPTYQDMGKCVPTMLYNVPDIVTMPAAVVPMQAAVVNHLGAYPNQFEKPFPTVTPKIAEVVQAQLHPEAVQAQLHPAEIPMQPCLPKLPFGNLHRFHDETHSYGCLSEDCRTFTKTKFGGRLSVITEDKVHTSGVHTYVVQFSKGEMSSADGLGFVFSPKLPCPKNIQRIVSIFVNSSGRICMRAQSQVMRSDVGIKPLELGDWISLEVDLGERVATFTVYPKNGDKSSSAVFAFGEALATVKHLLPRMPSLAAGHFAFVVKNRGVSVTVNS